MNRYRSYGFVSEKDNEWFHMTLMDSPARKTRDDTKENRLSRDDVTHPRDSLAGLSQG